MTQFSTGAPPCFFVVGGVFFSFANCVLGLCLAHPLYPSDDKTSATRIGIFIDKTFGKTYSIFCSKTFVSFENVSGKMLSAKKVRDGFISHEFLHKKYQKMGKM